MTAYSWGLLLCLLLHFLQISTIIHAFPPQPPARCDATGCILYNSYGVWNDRKDCYVTNATYPTTEEELRQAVAYASKKNLKVKVVSQFSHTIPKLACPGAQQAFGANSFLISTSKYNSVIEVDDVNLVVTVDSGVPLRQLTDHIEAKGLSLVAAPYWEGVSIGGLISTGSHGSSWWGNGGAVHDHVVGISVVVPAGASEGYAKIIRIGSNDPLLNATKLSLGLLGAISKVTLSVERAFKRSITYNFTDDGHVEDMVMEHARKYEFGDITWYPSRHTAVYRYDNRVQLDKPGDGVFDFLGFQSNSILVSQATRASERSFENARSTSGKCTLAASSLGFKKLIANGLKNNDLIFTGYPVIGRQGKMQTSGSCLYTSPARIDVSCAWDTRIKGLLFYESTAIFPASKFKDVLIDVKTLRDLIKPKNFCGVDIYNGFLIRFIKGSKAYLGQSEDSVVLDFNYYRANDAFTPRLNQDVWEEVEQMAFFKYGARPHWAKNRNLAFLNVQSKYPNMNKFLGVKKILDPQGIFSSEWSDQIFLGKEALKVDGCAMEGQCICSEDRHCSPQNGYLCKQGLVYKEARVCRNSPQS